VLILNTVPTYYPMLDSPPRVNLLEHVVIPWAPECTFPRDKKTINMFRMPNQMASLNVLLLEDVGEPLPLYSTPPATRRA